MKKVVISLFVALLATVGVKAQQIAVVSESGTTSMYQTLPEAIEGADPGSVIYLPGGGFQISDDVKITKKLTIIGIGHKANGKNADGNTVISDNLFFDGGSSGSSVMGCYISGDVYIGNDGSSVNDVTVRYCNLNSVLVKKSSCTGTIINQNYIRSESDFCGASVTITNNVFKALKSINGGDISYNVTCNDRNEPTNSTKTLIYVNNVSITHNIFRYGNEGLIHEGSNVQVSENFLEGGSWGDSPVLIDAGVDDIFENCNNWSISPSSNFHFKKDYKEYETKVGIYAGDGFSDSGMAPVPYILAKKVDVQTDASGKLNVKIRVKAGE